MKSGLILIFLLLASFNTAAQIPSPERIEEIIASRQKNSLNSNYYLIDNQSQGLITEQAHGGFRIEILPDECKRRQCIRSWMISGKMNSSEEFFNAWQNALNNNNGNPPDRVVLDSAGGSASAALLLAEVLSKYNISTEVKDWGLCWSACVYALAAGEKRIVGPWAKIGVHAQNSSSEIVRKNFGGVEENKPIITLSYLISKIDDATNEVQYIDGQIAIVLSNAGVSPFLLAYMNSQPHRYNFRTVNLIDFSCSEALGLHNPTGRLNSKDSVTIEERCGVVNNLRYDKWVEQIKTQPSLSETSTLRKVCIGLNCNEN